jgi:hypothetical protein
MGINESQPGSQTSAVAPTDQVRAHELTEAAHSPISKLAEGGQSGTSHAIPGDNIGTDDRRDWCIHGREKLLITSGQ